MQELINLDTDILTFSDSLYTEETCIVEMRIWCRENGTVIVITFTK